MLGGSLLLLQFIEVDCADHSVPLQVFSLPRDFSLESEMFQPIVFQSGTFYCFSEIMLIVQLKMYSTHAIKAPWQVWVVEIQSQMWFQIPRLSDKGRGWAGSRHAPIVTEWSCTCDEAVPSLGRFVLVSGSKRHSLLSLPWSGVGNDKCWSKNPGEDLKC